jgi:hypothetical protein
MTLEVRRATGPLPAAPTPPAPAAPGASGGIAPNAPAQGPAQNVEAHTQRLAAEAGQDMGALPWETTGAAATATVAAAEITGGPGAGDVQKGVQRVQRTTQNVQEAVTRYRAMGAERGITGFQAVNAMAQEDRAKAAARLSQPFDPSRFSGAARVETGMRALGLAQSVPALAGSVAALSDGASVAEVNALARNAVETFRGVDAAVQTVTGGRDVARLALENAGRVGGVVARNLNPVLAVTSAATTVVSSGQALMERGGEMSAAEIVSHTARLGGAVADVVGVVFPPAKLISAGLGLISMGADWFGGKG